MEIILEEHGNVIIVRLVGEFFLGNIKEVEKLWDEQVVKKPEVIAIDCKKLEFIDSSAIGTLVKFLNNSDKYNIHLIFFDLSASIIKIFNTTKLNKIFSIVSREEFQSKYLDR